jgi:hypothetical protein
LLIILTPMNIINDFGQLVKWEGIRALGSAAFSLYDQHL